MKSFYKLTLFLLGCIYLQSYTSPILANHAMAVDLSYTCLNEEDQTYALTLNFYFDCGSTIIQQPSLDISINAFSTLCGESIDVELKRDPNIPGEEVSQLCDDIINSGGSNCNGGIWPGVEKFVFEGVIQLPKKCEDWIINYRLSELEFRSASITNLADPDLKKIYVQATLDNTQGCNSSPSFASIPVSYYCTEGATFTQGVIEPDGDGLDFTLIQPLNNLNQPIQYTNSNTPQNPFPNNSFSFDDNTGEIQFQTDFAQFPVIAVLVEEYRNGKVIGSVMRDMQFVILECDNQIINPINLPNSETNPEEFSTTFTICANQNVELSFEFEDPDVDDVIDITARNISEFPDASFTQTPNSPNPAGAIFAWTPNLTDAGTHFLEVEVTDNHCPISSDLVYIYTIEVVGEPNIGGDLSFCEAGGPLEVDIEGEGTFTWTPDTHLTFLNAENSLVEIRPDEPTGTELTYTISNECNLSDELKVTVVQDVLLDFSEDVTICQGDPATMFALPISGDPSFYTYQWSPENEVNNPTAAAVITNPTDNSIYSVSVRSNETGCTLEHDFNIGVSTFTGEVNVESDMSEVCAGESVQLNATGVFNKVLECGVELNDQICNGGASNIFELGEAEGAEVTYTPYHGDKKGNRLQILYLQEDLTAIGMESGYLTSIAFNVVSLLSDGNVTYHEMSIKMGCTDVGIINDFQQGLQEVYFANDFVPTENWNLHEFFRPYKWDGASNLILEICYNDISVSSGSALFDRVAYTTTAYACVFRAFSSSGGGCNLGIGPNINNGFKRPDIQFGICPPQPETFPTITWEPVESLDNPNIANPIATPFETTTYTVTFNDNGCVGTEEITINTSNNIEFEMRSDTSVCESDNVPLYFIGDLPPTATFEWSPTIGLDNPLSPNPIAFATDNISYQVTVSLNDDCDTQVMEMVNISVEELSANVSEPSALCEGESMDLLAEGGVNYTWSNTESLSCTDCPNPIASPTTSSVYQVTVSNAANCTAVLTTAIEVNRVENVSINTGRIICPEDSVELLVEGGSLYEWLSFENLSCTDCPNPTANPAITTTYQVLITDEIGCNTTLETTVEISDLPEISSITSSQSALIGTTLPLEVTGNFSSVRWINSEGITDFFTSNPTLTIVESAIYTVEVSNENGCIATETVSIEALEAPEIIPCNEILIPNAFSPNDDGINDRFFPAPQSFDELIEFSIYSRSGKKVFSTTSPSLGWDGLLNFEPQPIGAYVYRVDAICEGETLREQGWVMLIR